MSLPVRLSNEQIKAEAKRLGFAHCGMAPAEPVDADFADYYRAWLEADCQADMHYLENHFEKRMNPSLLVEGTKTVISVALNYRPGHVAKGIAWYAQGRDYHDLMRERMQLLMEAIGAHGRCFVDTAPIPERYWAWRCGLGWIGKHSQLVIPHEGSTFFLGELFVEEEVDLYDHPMTDHCGRCQKCVEACPTGAIGGHHPNHPSAFDARRCLSYLTIENRGELPEWAGEAMGDMFYGCDRCLMACPHLQAAPTDEVELHPSDALQAMTPDDWQHLTTEQYRSLFKGSAVKRAKLEGLRRNLNAINRS